VSQSLARVRQFEPGQYPHRGIATLQTSGETGGRAVVHQAFSRWRATVKVRGFAANYACPGRNSAMRDLGRNIIAGGQPGLAAQGSNADLTDGRIHATDCCSAISAARQDSSRWLEQRHVTGLRHATQHRRFN
jgi:hypothetical protein